jgi:hypothetical protein
VTRTTPTRGGIAALEGTCLSRRASGGPIPIISDTTKQKVLAALIRHLCEDEDGMVVCAALREALIATLLTLDKRRRKFALRGFEDGGLLWGLTQKVCHGRRDEPSK